jgi:hypothetical protein
LDIQALFREVCQRDPGRQRRLAITDNGEPRLTRVIGSELGESRPKAVFSVMSVA